MGSANLNRLNFLVQVFGLVELLKNIGLYMSLGMIGLISYKPVIIIDTT
jgi:hypothetical protein